MRFPNGYGSIIELKGNRRKPYAVRVTTGYKDNGTQIFKYIGYFEKRTEALKCLVEYNTNPYDLKINTITFQEVYEEWHNRKFENISASTKNNYSVVYKKCTELYEMPFKNIKVNHLQSIIDKNKKLTIVPQFKYLFNQLYKYAIKHEIVEKNYSELLELPPKKESKPRIPFTKEEIDFLWNNLHVDHVDILLILLYSGLRISELLELKIENIHLEERYLFVEKSKTKAGIRKVPIHKKIEPLIIDRYSKENIYLIPNRKGLSISYNSFLKSQYHRLKKAINLNHNIHDTRHTFISQCDRLKLNNVSIQRIVGHTNINITQHYTKKSIEDLIEVIDMFDY